MAHPLRDTKSSTLTGGSASSGVSTDATSLVANLFSNSLSISSVSMYRTSKRRSFLCPMSSLYVVPASVRSGLGLPCRVYVHQDRVTQGRVEVGEARGRRSQNRSGYCQRAVRSGSRDIGLLVRDVERLVCCAVLIHPDCKTEPGIWVRCR